MKLSVAISAAVFAFTMFGASSTTTETQQELSSGSAASQASWPPWCTSWEQCPWETTSCDMFGNCFPDFPPACDNPGSIEEWRNCNCPSLGDNHPDCIGWTPPGSAFLHDRKKLLWEITRTYTAINFYPLTLRASALAPSHRGTLRTLI